MRCSWTESQSGGQVSWKTHDSSRTLTLTLSPQNNGWELDARQKKSGAKAERRIVQLCQTFSTEEQARRRIAEVTQGLVGGKSLREV